MLSTPPPRLDHDLTAYRQLRHWLRGTHPPATGFVWRRPVTHHATPVPSFGYLLALSVLSLASWWLLWGWTFTPAGLQLLAWERPITQHQRLPPDSAAFLAVDTTCAEGTLALRGTTLLCESEPPR